MAKRGAKEKYRKDFHPASFISHSKRGRHIAQIALRWGIHRDTIYDWGKKYPEFSDAIKIGKEFCEGWYMNLGQAAMLGRAKIQGEPVKVDLGFFVWMTKNVCKWSDRVDQKVTETPTVKRPLKSLSDEELDSL